MTNKVTKVMGKYSWIAELIILLIVLLAIQKISYESGRYDMCNEMGKNLTTDGRCIYFEADSMHNKLMDQLNNEIVFEKW